MLLTTKHLRLAKAIAEYGTLAGAARRLHLTPSALSHQLAAMERRLGTVLFERSAGRLSPTAAGAELLRGAVPLVHAIEQLETHVRDVEADARGRVRVWLDVPAPPYWLHRALADFTTEHPQARLSVHAGSEALPAELHADDIRLSVRARDRGPARALSLAEDELVLLAARAVGQRFPDLTQLPRYVIAGEPAASGYLELADEELSRGATVSVASAALPAALEVVSAGRATLLLPRAAARAVAPRYELRLLPVPGDPPPLRWYAEFAAGEPNALCAAFLQMLQRPGALLRSSSAS